MCMFRSHLYFFLFPLSQNIMQAPAFWHAILRRKDSVVGLANYLWDVMNRLAAFDGRLRRAAYALYRRLFGYATPWGCRKGTGAPPRTGDQRGAFRYTPPANKGRAASACLATLCGRRHRPDDFGTSPGQMVVRVRATTLDDGGTGYVTLGSLRQRCREEEMEKAGEREAERQSRALAMQAAGGAALAVNGAAVGISSGVGAGASGGMGAAGLAVGADGGEVGGGGSDGEDSDVLDLDDVDMAGMDWD